MSTIYRPKALPEDKKEEILAELAKGFGDMHGPQSFTEPALDWPNGEKPVPVTLNGVKGVALRSEGARRDLAFVHLHGGGFTGGSPVTGYRAMLALKQEYNMDSFSVDYSLAPEYKAPIQIEEAAAFYQAVLDMGYERVVIAGESAGATLCLALTLWLKDRNLPLPAAVAACSPALDLAGVIEIPVKDMFTEGGDEIRRGYIGGMNPCDPYISPVFGNYSGFPPLLLQAGTTESLHYQSLYLAKLLEKENCDCTVSIWEGAPHAIGLDVADVWFSRQCLRQILDFFAKKAGA